MEVEQSALEQLRDNFNDFDYVKHQLSDGVTSQIAEQHSALKAQQEAIHGKERRYFEAYTTAKEAILAQKELTLRDVSAEREQLMADEVYAADCETKLRAALESGEMTHDQHDRETAALEQERKRIQADKDNLEVILAENEAMTSEELQTLEKNRASQVAELNEEKNKLKTAIVEWETLLDSLSTVQSSHISATKQRILHLNVDLEDLETKLDGESEQVFELEKATQLKIEQVWWSHS